MKRLIQLGLAALLFGVPGCKEPYNPNRPKVYTQKLTINDLNNSRYLTQKSFEDGIEDLYKLLGEGKEEAWAYLPEKNLWIEIGYGEKKDETSIDVKHLEALMRENEKITVVHIHPNAENNDPKESAHRMLTSIEDLKTMVSHSNLFFNNHECAYTDDIEFIIVSQLGITRYGLRYKGVQNFQDKSEREIEYALGYKKRELEEFPYLLSTKPAEVLGYGFNTINDSNLFLNLEFRPDVNIGINLKRAKEFRPYDRRVKTQRGTASYFSETDRFSLTQTDPRTKVYKTKKK